MCVGIGLNFGCSEKFVELLLLDFVIPFRDNQIVVASDFASKDKLLVHLSLYLVVALKVLSIVAVVVVAKL